MTGSRAKLALIAALFAAPIMGAWLIYGVVPGWQPQGRVNHGTLVTPARPLPDLQLADARGAPVSGDVLRRKWSLVILGGESCDAACRERLVLTRQVWKALNQDRERVQRVYLAPGVAAAAAARAALAGEHSDLVVLADVGPAGRRATDALQPPGATLHVVDPHGNWMMWYQAPLDPRSLHQDLKRLLKFSLIGRGRSPVSLAACALGNRALTPVFLG